MEPEVKIVAIVAGAALLLMAGGLGTCNYQAKLDASAPVVETCIKHPVTKPPFRGTQ